MLSLVGEWYRLFFDYRSNIFLTDFFSVERLLVLSAGWRNENPDPWTSCKSFQFFLAAVVFGVPPSPQTIDPEQVASAKAKGNEVDYWEVRVKRAEEKAKRRAEEYRQEQEEYLRELSEIGNANEDLIEYSAGFGLDPTRAYLFPIQQYLGVTCDFIRVLKNVLTWEESYISFLVSVICFVLSIVVFFVPWAFCIKWLIRIVVWLGFGPWMKLVDMFYFAKLDSSDSEKERKNKLQLEREKKLKQHKKETQLKREKASKLRDFKQYMFGEHICRVNILKKDRYYDIPLETSSATPYTTKDMRKSLGTLVIEEAGFGVSRVEGQQLEGDMIPKVSEIINRLKMRGILELTASLLDDFLSQYLQICDVPANAVKAGQVTKRTDLLESGSEGKVYSGKDDSSVSAFMKVFTIVLGAGAVTVFGIPLLSWLFGKSYSG